MKKKNYLFFALAALAFTACSSDDELGSGSTSNNQLVAAQISAGIGGTSTRADGATWEADAVGVMVTNSTSDMSTMYQNVKYSTTSETSGAASFTSTDGIYFQDATETVTFAAYGPYVESTDQSIATLPGSSGVISDISTTDQSTRAKQKAFDYIYASGAQASKTKPNVIFNDNGSSENAVAVGTSFNHKMSKLVIIIKPSGGLTYSDIQSGAYTLTGLIHEGKITIVSGTTPSLTAATTGSVSSAWSLTDYSYKEEDSSAETVTFTSILFPQDMSSLTDDNKPVFTATIDGQTYTNTGGINPNMAAGCTYTYTVTMTQQGIETVIGEENSGWTANDWTSTDGVSVGATM